MPVTPRQPLIFPVEQGFHDTEVMYVDTNGQDDLRYATWWALHLRIDGPLEEVGWTIKRLEEIAFGQGYIGGDSWVEWCEPHPDSEVVPRALHVTFRAPSQRVALMRARNVCRLLGQPYLTNTHVHLTTARDWSEGHEVWEVHS